MAARTWREAARRVWSPGLSLRAESPAVRPSLLDRRPSAPCRSSELTPKSGDSTRLGLPTDVDRCGTNSSDTLGIPPRSSLLLDAFGDARTRSESPPFGVSRPLAPPTVPVARQPKGASPWIGTSSTVQGLQLAMTCFAFLLGCRPRRTAWARVPPWRDAFTRCAGASSDALRWSRASVDVRAARSP
jgi:hypothetical protein